MVVNYAMFGKDSLSQFFVDEESLLDFLHEYYKKAEIKSTCIFDEFLELYGFLDCMADRISSYLRYNLYEIGDLVSYELFPMLSYSGEHENIYIGQLVEVPVPHPEQVDDEKMWLGCFFQGDYVGEYKFKKI